MGGLGQGWGVVRMVVKELGVQIRKQSNMPKDSKYLVTKCNSAVVAKLMSDDEDGVEEDGTRTA